MMSTDIAAAAPNEEDGTLFSGLDPRRFTPNLHAQLVGEILKLRENAESKGELILGLEEQLSLLAKDNTDLERSTQATRQECRNLRRQLQVLEGGSDSVLETLKQERDSMSQVLDELKKRTEALQNKLKSRDDEVERINSLWESDRQKWEENRRVADRKIHVAESRVHLLADELESIYVNKSDSAEADNMERTHSRQGHQEVELSLSLGGASRFRDSQGDLEHEAAESIANTSLDVSHPQTGAQTTVRSLAEELNSDVQTEDSYDCESEDALPEEQLSRTRPYSSQSSPEAAKARKILGLDILDDVAPAAQYFKMGSENYGEALGRSITTKNTDIIQLRELRQCRDRSTQWSLHSSSAEDLYARNNSDNCLSQFEQPMAKPVMNSAAQPPDEDFKGEHAICEQCRDWRLPMSTRGCQTDEPSVDQRLFSKEPYAEHQTDGFKRMARDASTQTDQSYTLAKPRNLASTNRDPKIPKIHIRRPTSSRVLNESDHELDATTASHHKNTLAQTMDSEPPDTERVSISAKSVPLALTETVLTTGEVDLEDIVDDGAPLPHTQWFQSRRNAGNPYQQGGIPDELNRLNLTSGGDDYLADSGSRHRTIPETAAGSPAVRELVIGDLPPASLNISSVDMTGLSASYDTNVCLSQSDEMDPSHAAKHGSEAQQPTIAEGQGSASCPISDQTSLTNRVVDETVEGIGIIQRRNGLQCQRSSSTTTSNGEAFLEPPYPVPNRSSSKRLHYDIDSASHSDGVVSSVDRESHINKSTHMKTLATPVSRRASRNQNELESLEFGKGKGRSVSERSAPSLAPDESIHSAGLKDSIPLQNSAVGSIRGALISDSMNVVDAIAQTMVGEWMWKYVRKRRSFGLPETPVTEFELGKNSDANAARHQRWVWVAPYERAIMWSSKQPTSSPALLGKSGRKLIIQSVLDVRDESSLPFNLASEPSFGRSILILTAQRALKFTAKSQESHYMWLTALSFLSHSDSVPGSVKGRIFDSESQLINANSMNSSILGKRGSNVSMKTSARKSPAHAANNRSKQRLELQSDQLESATHFIRPPDHKSLNKSQVGRFVSHYSDGEEAAEPPLVPRFSNHSRKRSMSGFSRKKPRSLKHISRSRTSSSKPNLQSYHLKDDLTEVSGTRKEWKVDENGNSLHHQIPGTAWSEKSVNTDAVRQYRTGKSLFSSGSQAQLHGRSSIKSGSENFFEAIGTVRMEAFVQGLDDVDSGVM